MGRIDDTIGAVAYTLDCLKALREIWNTGSCNDCADRKCQYKPKPGQLVRYNCPSWIEQQKTKQEIKVGDEVTIPYRDRHYIVSEVSKDSVKVKDKELNDMGIFAKGFPQKTGRHFDAFEQLLKELEE